MKKRAQDIQPGDIVMVGNGVEMQIEELVKETPARVHFRGRYLETEHFSGTVSAMVSGKNRMWTVRRDE